MRFLASNSFAQKMTLMALVASGIASATLMVAFLANDSISSRAQLESRLSSLANIVGQNSAAALDFDDRAAARDVLEALKAEPSIVSACLYERSGSLFATYDQKSGKHECATRQSDVVPVVSGFSSVKEAVEHHGDFAGTLYLVCDLEGIHQRWRHLLQVTCWLLIGALIVGGVSGALLQRSITKPIRELAEVMQEVTERHNFNLRVTPRGTSEIALLGVGFNGMLQELEKRDEEKKAFEAKLAFQALNDELTGLPNRRLLADRLGY